MGLLYLGTAYSWDEASKYAEHVRQHGITQFLHIWDRLKDRMGDELLWGDEIEYMVVDFKDDEKNAVLSLRQAEILAKLSEAVTNICTQSPVQRETMPTFHPEYGRFMLESTPGAPYTGSLPDLISVERNMRYRRKLARCHLKPTEIPITLPSYPRLGVQGVFTEPYYDPANAKASHSLFLPDEITNPHVRFPTLTANIRERRGSKVAINLPIFVDENTPQPFIDPSIPWERNIYKEDPEAKNGAALQDHIYMDAMGFGMGCSCLQITFQACNVSEALRVYDALVPVGPIMLAITAASPAWRGYLADVDCRWNVIAGSVDDRNEEERGLKPLQNSRFVIPKSRYDSVDSYLSEDWINRPEYNDTNLLIDEGIFQRLKEHGLPERLAKHIAHLFIRDPLVVFSETVDQDDEQSSDHFENIQSTNWQTLRFKPPPPHSPIGWRVEFRSMEVSMTDFENAAFSVFIVLLSRAILKFGLNFYIPISKVDENMQRAQKRDAVHQQKFFFRKNVLPVHLEHSYKFHEPRTPSASGSASPPSRDESAKSSGCGCGCGCNGSSKKEGQTQRPMSNGVAHPHVELNGHTHHQKPIVEKVIETLTAGVTEKETTLRNCFPEVTLNTQPPANGVDDERRRIPVEEEYEEMTIEEVICGKGEFPGLLGLVNAYINSLDVDFKSKRKLRKYLELVRMRSNGTLSTTATWMRDFIRSHPAYKKDSVISQEINYDLLKAADEIERGVRKAPDLLPSHYGGSDEDDNDDDTVDGVPFAVSDEEIITPDRDASSTQKASSS